MSTCAGLPPPARSRQPLCARALLLYDALQGLHVRQVTPDGGSVEFIPVFLSASQASQSTAPIACLLGCCLLGCCSASAAWLASRQHAGLFLLPSWRTRPTQHAPCRHRPCGGTCGRSAAVPCSCTAVWNAPWCSAGWRQQHWPSREAATGLPSAAACRCAVCGGKGQLRALVLALSARVEPLLSWRRRRVGAGGRRPFSKMYQLTSCPVSLLPHLAPSHRRTRMRAGWTSRPRCLTSSASSAARWHRRRAGEVLAAAWPSPGELITHGEAACWHRRQAGEGLAAGMTVPR